MLARFVEHTRCPLSLVEAVPGPGRRNEPGQNRSFARFDAQGSFPNGRLPLNGAMPASIRSLLENSPDGSLPANADEIVDNLRFERYIDNALQGNGRTGAKSAARKIYYLLRPLFPVAFRKHLQRIALKGWDKRSFPAWPVDFTVDNIFEDTFRYLGRTLGLPEIPFIWYWPDGCSAGCIMTHDVETKAGRDFCGTIMKMEARYGLSSSFELVPEQRYEVPMDLLAQIRAGGCEVCVHGLNHDGKLFSSKSTFLDRARKINEYAEKWGATGFRSPVMYRNLDWFPALKISYDMSVPNVGHLDPQPGGCCTVMPYFIGDILELPLTTIQDYPLYHILKQRSLDLWRTQSEKILQRHGLISFIIHPDYTTAPWAQQLYDSLLEYLAGLRDDRRIWFALPHEVNSWWRERSRMELVSEDSQWRIRGPGSDRARVAYASVDGDKITYLDLNRSNRPTLISDL